jgi:hypothetical protein
MKEIPDTTELRFEKRQKELAKKKKGKKTPEKSEEGNIQPQDVSIPQSLKSLYQ